MQLSLCTCTCTFYQPAHLYSDCMIYELPFRDSTVVREPHPALCISHPPHLGVPPTIPLTHYPRLFTTHPHPLHQTEAVAIIPPTTITFTTQNQDEESIKWGLMESPNQWNLARMVTIRIETALLLMAMTLPAVDMLA